MFAGARVRRLGTALGGLAFIGLVVGLPIAVNFRFASDALQRSWVYAGGREAVLVTTPVLLSRAPHITLQSGLVYDPETTRTGAPAASTSIVIDGPVITVATSSEPAQGEGAEEAVPHILSQLSTLGFEKLSVRRGTLIVWSKSRSKEIFSDLTIDVVSNRKGSFTGKGGGTYRGSGITFEAAWSVPPGGQPSLRIPLNVTVKSAILDATVDGRLEVADDLRLQGTAAVSAPKLRQVARWFGIAVPSGSDLKSVSIRGALDWGGAMLTFSRATLALDGNEGTGALTLNVSGAVPSLEGTVAFQHFDLSQTSVLPPALASIWPLGFGPGAEEEGTLSLLTRFNADLRVSAAKVTLPHFQTGRAAAAIAVKDGRLLADIAELEVEGGTFGGQISADMSGPIPRYGLTGKLENVDAGRSLSGVLHRNPLQGRANVTLSLSSSGHDNDDVLSNLSGKIGLSLVDGGRLGLDLRALLYAAQRSEVKGWAAAGKGQTALESLDAQLQLKDGVIMSERLQAKSAALTIAGSGRADATTKELDIVLLLTTPTESAPASANTLLLTGNWHNPSIRVEQQPKLTATPR